MDLGIKGRVALVSGGSKGMGLAAARILAADGARVAIVARSQGPIDEAVAGIVSAGGEAIGVSADMTTREGVAKAVAQTKEQLGSPGIAVSIVQDNVAGDFDDVTDDEFERFFKIYAMSVVYLAREVIPDMKENGWGRFVAVGSAAAKEPEGMIHHMLANTTRPAAIGFTKTLADEVAKYGITVNTVAPGWIGTENMYSYLKEKVNIEPDKVDEFLGDNVPARRVGTPEEIGSTIAYLCSDLAGYLNGEWIAVDGAKHRAAF